MVKLQKIFIAALLFVLATYAAIVGGQQINGGDGFAGRIILAGVAVAVVLINFLILSAEGTKPYDDVCRARREILVLRRALKQYAQGLDDTGVFAGEIIKRMYGRESR